MSKYAGIIVNISHESVDRAFSYRIPTEMENDITIGTSVNVPFGSGNKLRKGYVISLHDYVDYDEAKVKEIDSVVMKQVDSEDVMIRLAAWIRNYYGSTMIQALKIVLPVKQAVKPMEKKTVLLQSAEMEALDVLEACKRKSQKGKARLLEALIPEKVLDYQLVRGKLNIAASTLTSLEKQGVIKVNVENYFRNPIVIEKSKEKDNTLNEEQQYIVDDFSKDFTEGKRGVYLIHGVTGSGKTECYIQMIKTVVAEGKQVIFLIPEIALTYQTVLRFYHHFGERVSIVNSVLSAGEKYDQFERAKKGEIDVMIGPRSALFTPFKNLGLIVMDEEHESSYKSESMPKYHAREVAIQLAKMVNASVVLGSATPSVDSYYHAKKGDYKLYRLCQRATGGNLPQVHLVDLRQELKEGNRSVFSRQMQSLIEDRLEKKEQIMLFLNRRGYAGFISCRSCGEVIKCPHCDISLSEHKDGSLRCHYCGHTIRKPSVCPTCGSKYILGFRAGTQQIEEQVLQMFPTAKILRMDKDTTAKKDSYEEILTAFKEEKADILIGTQMIVKGHDFPNVTLMGIVAADLSLAANDYRAGERTFDLLTQAAGRAGRGDKAGDVVIQTYQPEHYANVHAANQDYESFYSEEILYRELSGYPPICHILTIMVQSKDENEAYEYVLKLCECTKNHNVSSEAKLKIVGPAPAGIQKINDYYRQIFFVKSGNEELLTEIKGCLENYISHNLNKNVLVQFDYDPLTSF